MKRCRAIQPIYYRMVIDYKNGSVGQWGIGVFVESFSLRPFVFNRVKIWAVGVGIVKCDQHFLSLSAYFGFVEDGIVHNKDTVWWQLW